MIPLPDGGVEHVGAVVPFGLVEFEGLGVGFGYGERDFANPLAHKLRGGHGEE